ncbi:hypothetical protein YC2023_111805 [Brassica napus]
MKTGPADPNHEIRRFALETHQGDMLDTCKHLESLHATRRPPRLDLRLTAQPPTPATDTHFSPDLRYCRASASPNHFTAALSSRRRDRRSNEISIRL